MALPSSFPSLFGGVAGAVAVPWFPNCKRALCCYRNELSKTFTEGPFGRTGFLHPSRTVVMPHSEPSCLAKGNYLIVLGIIVSVKLIRSGVALELGSVSAENYPKESPGEQGLKPEEKKEKKYTQSAREKLAAFLF